MKQIRSLRGSLASKTRESIFSTYGELTLPSININANPSEIAEWKKSPEFFHVTEVYLIKWMMILIHR